jgi:hypothetical protein
MNDDRKIVRTYSAGVFLANIESRNGKEAVLRDARRLWYWDGAASLSQVAIDGVGAQSKIVVPTQAHLILDAIEVIPCEAKNRNSRQIGMAPENAGLIGLKKDPADGKALITNA